MTKNKPDIKVILFDLDDTLVVEYRSAEESFIEAGKKVYAQYGIVPEEFYLTAKNKARELWYGLPTINYAKKTGISSWEALWAGFEGEDANSKQLKKISAYYQTGSWKKALAHYDIIDDMLAIELSGIFKTERRKRHILFPESAEVLLSLSKDFRLGLITNGLPDLQSEKIDGAGIRNHFEDIFISGNAGCRKPGKKIFKMAIDSFGIKKDNCIMIGNSIDSDIRGANKSGIISVWINRESRINTTKIKPDFEIKNLKEIFDILPNLRNINT